MARILIVDDDPALRRALGDRLRHWGHLVDDVATAALARTALAEHECDLVLLDLALPDGSGLDVLRGMREDGDERDVVVLTAHGSIESAVEAIRAGATDFLLKPADFELLRAVVDRVLERRRLARVARSLEERVAEGEVDLVGESAVMKTLFATATQAARSRATLLITGESGTGKQKLAEFVHRRSDRAAAPFVYVNCVALAEELIEDTLFGHEKGAFTGAIARKTGRLEAADGGTAFLDEIGDISPRLQAKLLHFLETGEFERVGGTQTLRVDCRLVAATNRDLPRATREGRFREDLYFRLNVIGLHLPPLRERREDIPRLAGLFLDRYARELKKGPLRLAPATLERLVRQPWPGNVRQLRNAIERMAVLAPGTDLTPDLLPPELADDGAVAGAGAADAGAGADAAPTLDLRAATDAFRRGHIRRVLDLAGGNRTRAAGLLGIQRTHLSLLLRQLGLAGGTGAGDNAAEADEAGPPPGEAGPS